MDTITPTPPWFAFRIAPQKERAAHELLTKRGFTSLFVHEVRETRRVRHKRYQVVKRTTPLLPSYALVQHDGTESFWYRLFAQTWPGMDVRVIYSVIGCEGRPYAIPSASMDHLMALSGVEHRLPTKRKIAVGDTVRIRVGEWRNFTAQVEQVNSKRVKVLLGLFGRPVETLVSVRDVELAA